MATKFLGPVSLDELAASDSNAGKATLIPAALKNLRRFIFD